VRRAVRHKRLQWSRLFRSLFVPLLLVIAQQGAALHELSHYAPTQTTGDSKKQAPRGDICELCLAFAQIGSAAPSQAVVAPLLAGLSHELVPVSPVHLEVAQLPAERSRGPPLYL
jgi:hypothetical protein